MSYRLGALPNTYRYNGQTAFALVPALLVLAGFGGQVVMGTFMVGGMITYILDAMQYREGSFASLWITLVAANLGLLMANDTFSPLRLLGIESPLANPEAQDRPALLSFLLLLVGGQTLLLTGCWATLQFKWIHHQYPVVAFAVEKLVVQGAVPVAAPVHAWGLIAAVGGNHTPYYLAGIMCGMYRMFCLPLAPSFSTSKGKGDKDSVIQSKVVTALTALLVIVLPAAFYLAMHLAVITSWTHFWSLTLLVSAPTLWVCVLDDGLWWLGSSPAIQNVTSKVVALAALATTVAGLEGRVVFRSFEQYINLHPPWSYIIITAAMYGAAAVVVLQLTGLLGRVVDSSVGGVVLVLSAAGGSVAVGLPLTIIPAPLCAAAGISLYYESRNVRDYLLFVVGSALTSAWFLYHHFWFLEIHLGSYTVRQVCSLMMALLIPALLAPGLLLSDSSRFVITILLVIQAILACLVEEQLFAGAHGEEEMYPTYMVILTSTLGIIVVNKVAEIGKMSIWGLWVCRACYAAKLAMLAVPEAYMVQPALLYALAVSAPVALYPINGAALSTTRHRVKIKPWQAIGHAGLVIGTVGAGRFAVFDLVQWVTDSQPSEAVAAGALLLAAGIGCVPLVQRHYPSHAGVRNATLGVCMLAVLLFMLRPPFPVRTGAKCPHLPFGLCPRLWDEAHAPYHEADDLAIYGFGESRKSHQPLWLLIAAVCCGFLSMSPGDKSGLPGFTELSWKLMVSAVSGSCVAGFVSLEFFRYCFALQLVLWGGMLLVASSVVLLQASAHTTASALASIIVWMLSFPLALLLEASSDLPPLGPSSERLFPDAARDVELERHNLRRSSLLAVFAAQAVLLAFVIKLKVPLLASRTKGKLHPDEPPPANGMIGGLESFLGGMTIPAACLPSMPFPVTSSKALKGGSALRWACLVGNMACLMAFTLALLLSFRAAGTLDSNIFALAPLLLLLNQDDFILRGLDSGRRYFPPATAVVVYLGANAANQLMEATMLGVTYAASPLPAGTSHLWYFLRNALCLAACLPTHASFLKYLWDWAPRTDSQLLVLTALNLVALCLTDVETVQLLAVLAMVVTCVQHLSMRQQSRRGKRVI